MSLIGLENLMYIDKPDNRKEKIEGSEPIMLQKAVDESNGQLDRIYRNSPNTVELLDKSRNITYTIEKSVNISDFVVFNPGINGKRGAAANDFDDEGYQVMLCVEPAIAVGTYKLDPLSSWSGSQKIEYKRNGPAPKEEYPDFIK